MSKGGVLVYRCRKCGKLDKSTHAPDVNMAVILIAQGAKLPSEWGGFQPKMIGIHACKDNEAGITDLIGGEED